MSSPSNAIAYQPGVPCWVESLQPDPRAAAAFYGGVFGWDPAGPGPMPSGGEYFVARLGGSDVAGIGSLPPGGIARPHWATYVLVDDVVSALERATSAGGRAIGPPLDAVPAGTLAVVEDPAGATFGLWQARERIGAQRINEPSAWAMSMLRTRDLGAANAFYAQVFGWSTQPFDADGARGVLYRLRGYVGGTPQQPVPRDVVAAALEVPDDEPSHWSVDFGSPTSTRPSSASRNSADRSSGRRSTCRCSGAQWYRTPPARRSP
jgi:predicted enzyme related to lactoylglutathione lyase